MKRTFILLMSAAALIAVLKASARAEVLEVPGDYSSITLALEATNPHDTILVHPGTYEDRLIFPAHDVVLISDYFVTGDSSIIDSTIIDASIFAELDTASVLTFINGNSNASLVGGFTLTGGHGLRQPSGSTHGGCVLVQNSNPTIHSCVITRNSAYSGMVIFSVYGSPTVSYCDIHHNCGHLNTAYFTGTNTNSDPAVFEWNNVHDNYACDSAYGNSVYQNSVTAEFGNLIVRFNHFHDYIGNNVIGTIHWASPGAIYGNVFERLSTTDWGDVIFIYDEAVPVEDNMIRDSFLGTGGGIFLGGSGGYLNPHRIVVERNWLENLSNTSMPTCIFMQHPNAEVRENVFFNCRGILGAVQLTQAAGQGCDVVFERNHFFFNQANNDCSYVGSAFASVGFGHPCTFTNNWFEGNEGWAVYLDSTIQPQADMSNNYWGDPSGPYHPIENPEGLGDSVHANVLVTPWLTEPPGLSAKEKDRLHLHPEDWSIEQAFPNPFNLTTSLRITSSKPQPFEVIAYNTLGQRAASVWQGVIPKDTPTLVRWYPLSNQGRVLASGIYYLVAIPKGPGAGAPKTVKVVLLK